jgi:hypothetical protein
MGNLMVLPLPAHAPYPYDVENATHCGPLYASKQKLGRGFGGVNRKSTLIMSPSAAFLNLYCEMTTSDVIFAIMSKIAQGLRAIAAVSAALWGFSPDRHRHSVRGNAVGGLPCKRKLQ